MEPPRQHRDTDMQRNRTFAEYELISLPQVALHPAPEVANGVAGNERHPIGDTTNCTTEAPRRSLCTRVKNIFWGSPKKRMTLAVFLSVVIVAAISLGAALGTTGIRSSPEEASQSESTTEGTSTTKASSTTSTTVSIAPECTAAEIVENIGWTGITDGSGWKWLMVRAPGYKECCTHCYTVQSDCNAWQFIQVENGLGAECTLIYEYNGPNPDSTCPRGHPGVTFRVEDTSHGIGGGGPCSGPVTTT